MLSPAPPACVVLQNVAYLFNRVAGDKSEGWEAITLVTFVAATAIIVLGVGMGPETSLKVFANNMSWRIT